jgi:Family of unknown function (DUF6492)
MKSPEFALITPSYTLDFERCKLLARSVQEFCQSSVTHYIIVTRKDFPLFKQLQGSHTEVITVESILPKWLIKLPFIKNGWLSLKTPPIRNWVVQQLVKISVGQHISQEIMTFVDSDLTFIRPFNLQNFVHDSQVRLFRVNANVDVNQERPATPWEKSAAKLLGLPVRPTPFYVGGIVTWKRDNLLKMYRHIEQVSGRDFIETLCYSWNLSEYNLYGTFVEFVLQEGSGHFWDDRPICKEYWKPVDLSDEDLAAFFQEITAEHIAVMISAKANISPHRYQALIEAIPSAAQYAS